MSTKQTNIKKPNTVRIASIQLDGVEDVYNMEVLGTHNFAVNGGLIVHNCMDAVRYFVMTKRIYRKQEKYQSIFGWRNSQSLILAISFFEKPIDK